MRVLLVEDERDVQRSIASALRKQSHEVECADDGEAALEMARSQAFDVYVLDRMLPKQDGLSVLSELRGEGDDTPALILSALGQVDDRVEGLRAGGDDYLPKPFDMGELIARIEVLGRRPTRTEGETSIRVADLELDRIRHAAQRSGTPITLQPREYRLLEYLMRNAGQVVTRKMLLENVWDYHFDPGTNVIDVHVSRLRGKIDKEFDRPLLHTVRGTGYVLQETPPATA